MKVNGLNKLIEMLNDKEIPRRFCLNLTIALRKSLVEKLEILERGQNQWYDEDVQKRIDIIRETLGKDMHEKLKELLNI